MYKHNNTSRMFAQAMERAARHQQKAEAAIALGNWDVAMDHSASAQDAWEEAQEYRELCLEQAAFIKEERRSRFSA